MEEDYRKAFMSIEYTTVVEQAWQGVSLPEILTRLGDNIGIDLSNSLEWFSEKQSLVDPKDIMGHEMSFEQFKRRIGNYCLYKLYIKTPHTSISARKYIKQMRIEMRVPK